MSTPARTTPADAQERLALYQSLLASKSDKIDVFQIDVVWPGILARQFLDLNQFIEPSKLDGYFQSQAFRDNPVGVTYDPEELVSRVRDGLRVEELAAIN